MIVVKKFEYYLLYCWGAGEVFNAGDASDSCDALISWHNLIFLDFRSMKTKVKTMGS